MSFSPKIPVRSSVRYTEIRCPACGDIRFYKRRHMMDGPGEAGICCASCGKAPVKTRYVSGSYVLLHDPLRQRRIEGEPDPVESMRSAWEKGKLFPEQESDEAE